MRGLYESGSLTGGGYQDHDPRPYPLSILFYPLLTLMREGLVGRSDSRGGGYADIAGPVRGARAFA